MKKLYAGAGAVPPDNPKPRIKAARSKQAADPSDIRARVKFTSVGRGAVPGGGKETVTSHHLGAAMKKGGY